MNINQLMKQAQEMQKKLAKQQEELASKEFEASSGGGMVTAKINGAGALLSVKIDPSVVDPEDVEMLEDLVVAAINEAQTVLSSQAQDGMQGMMNQMGIKLPGM
ncbi:MAG: YbaB/EbfC family nucleoid-associated protein [bacterium]|nr:YbaB/EbfC family nucleoid-associated protein [bacterium]MBU1918122.1 YbaB/EbfC family nucleoid-associated protein [bacterium]